MTASEFKNTILPTYGAMLNLAKKLLPHNDEAADIVQDVLRGLWEKYNDIPVPDNPFAFTLRCVRNRCIDTLRRNNIFVRIEDSEINNISEEKPEDDFQENLNIVIKNIEKLDEPRRTIMRLSLQGSSTAEIARQTALSESNIRQILFRVRRHLRKIIVQNQNY